MFGVVDLPTYLAGLVLIILLPGPNSLYVLSVAARRGVRSGYTAAAGVWCGDAVLMTLSAAGVASLLQANAVLFGIVKYAGAGYLAWLAVGMLRAAWGMWRGRGEESAEDTAPAAASSSPPSRVKNSSAAMATATRIRPGSAKRRTAGAAGRDGTRAACGPLATGAAAPAPR